MLAEVAVEQHHARHVGPLAGTARAGCAAERSRLPSLTKMTSYGDAERVERRIQAREQRGEARFLVVDRNDDRDFRLHRRIRDSCCAGSLGVRCRFRLRADLVDRAHDRRVVLLIGGNSGSVTMSTADASRRAGTCLRAKPSARYSVNRWIARVVHAGADAAFLHARHEFGARELRPFGGSTIWNMCQLLSVEVLRRQLHAEFRRDAVAEALEVARAPAAGACAVKRRAASTGRGRCAPRCRSGCTCRRATSTSMPSKPRARDALQPVFLARRHRFFLVVQHQAPPSIVVTFLLAWKLNETKSPKEPMRLPRQVEPNACAASSITRSLCSLRDGVEPVHVDRQAGQVDRHDAPCVRGVIACFQLVEIDVARDRIDVDEHRRRADFQDHVGGGDPGHRRGDDFVARRRCRRCAARFPSCRCRN